jgi:ubiquinone/menaquinone biosynthesis C-methylase UbiE
MKTQPEWQWEEFQQRGTDYTDLAQVEIYDQRMSSFRDVEGENREMLERLALAPGAAVLEIGCGTGRFARAAARAGMAVTAIDVSEIMLEFVRQRVDEEGLPAIATRHAVF